MIMGKCLSGVAQGNFPLFPDLRLGLREGDKHQALECRGHQRSKDSCSAAFGPSDRRKDGSECGWGVVQGPPARPAAEIALAGHCAGARGLQLARSDNSRPRPASPTELTADLAGAVGIQRMGGEDDNADQGEDRC